MKSPVDLIPLRRYYYLNGAAQGGTKGDKKTGWLVTVERNDGFAKAEFQWDESFDSCTVKAYGFDDEEYEMLLENGAHEGANVEGYAVSIK